MPPPTPSTPGSASQSVNVNAPVFVPRGVVFKPSSSLSGSVSGPDTDNDLSASTGHLPAVENSQLPTAPTHDVFDAGYHAASSGLPSAADLSGYGPTVGEVAADPYYHQSYTLRPLNHHLYSPASKSSTSSAADRLYTSDTLREDLLKRSETIWAVSYPTETSGLPESVNTYHSILPLEWSNPLERRKSLAGWSSFVYRALEGLTQPFKGFRLLHEPAFAAVEKWVRLSHPNVVKLREAFTTKAFGDHSLVFVYDFHPGAQTLYAAHLASDPSASGPRATWNLGNPIPKQVQEDTLWAYIIQIASAIKAAHDQGMALRLMDVSKVLLTGKNRIRVDCCSVLDILTWNPTLSLDLLQQEDLIAFGKLIYVLGCRDVNALDAAPKAIETLIRSYSPAINNFAYFLLTKSTKKKTIDEVWVKLAPRMAMESAALFSYADTLENQMMSELENARLVRLLSKLGFVNERPDFSREGRWSETGDRYIIKLFRDFVFHQVDEMGKPVMNMGHVLTCLNKLDAGVEERIMLVSRDEQSCLVVSYKEIKTCLETAFNELVIGGN
ncbi:PAB-dependent poly(A)-specific ribonuclease subunit 3 [Tulasnella sp. 427]|nr:PAB-dependent poly(A)-specific ribonuclease subunit 3 [Tulasnella sp. 427]